MIMENARVSLVLTCAGSGERAGFGYNKLLKDLGGTTPFEKCLSAFVSSGVINQYIITCRKEDEEVFSQKAEGLGITPIFAIGGDTRSKSVYEGVKKADGEIILVHDGARPFVSERIIRDCALAALKFGSGVAAIAATDTICDTQKVGEDVFITSTSRKGKYLVQTPQAFNTEELKRAFSMMKPTDEFTDESGLYAAYIGKCKLVEGSADNKKLTYKSDFALSGDLYAGTGFDLHTLAEGRKLILGGIEIPHTKGLLGHSDADVLTHAIMDAMLSAASLGDIGKHFPDTDERYKGISSMILLENVRSLIHKSGYKLKNVAAVIMAQKPKLSPFVEKIRKNLAEKLGVEESSVGITCTTLEGIGIVGREEGIAVQAYCLMQRQEER